MFVCCSPIQTVERIHLLARILVVVVLGLMKLTPDLYEV